MIAGSQWGQQNLGMLAKQNAGNELGKHLSGILGTPYDKRASE
jgi:hypothetical protein